MKLKELKNKTNNELLIILETITSDKDLSIWMKAWLDIDRIRYRIHNTYLISEDTGIKDSKGKKIFIGDTIDLSTMTKA